MNMIHPVSPLQIAKFTILSGAVKGNPWPPEAAALLLSYGQKDDRAEVRKLRALRRAPPLRKFEDRPMRSGSWDI